MENETCVRVMKVEEIVNRVFTSKTYILPVDDQRDCWLVDCGDVEKVIEQGWNILGVLLTHVHTDHIYGLNKLIEEFPDAVIYTNAEGVQNLQNPRWNFSRYHDDVEDFVFDKPENVRVIDCEGVIELEGGLTVEALFTPGHEPSCVSYRLGDMLFTGDSYIPGVKVVTTFPRSNKQLAVESLVRLQELEASGLKVMPGHWIEKKED